MKTLLKKIVPGFLIRIQHYLEEGQWSRIKRGIWELHPAASQLNKETGMPYLTLLCDIGLSYLNFVFPDEYKAYSLFEKSRYARKQFLTQHRMIWAALLFNPRTHRSLFNNKDTFNRHFQIFLGRRWIYAPDASDQMIEDFLCEQKELIVKPRSFSEGDGIHKVVYSEITDIKAFCESARKNCFMLEEVIKQHPDLSTINPTSVNTCRIITVLDKVGVPHILCAALRMGRGDTFIDNLTRGGIVAQIDSRSGIVLTPGIGKDLRTHIKHPTSGVILPGFQIPHWEAAKEMVLCSAKMAPLTRWVGWDVAITNKAPLLVEGNIRPGHQLMQLAPQKGYWHILRRYL